MSVHQLATNVGYMEQDLSLAIELARRTHDDLAALLQEAVVVQADVERALAQLPVGGTIIE
jgi:hypothetical protein